MLGGRDDEAVEHVRSGRLAGRDRVGAVDAYNIGGWLTVPIPYRLVFESRKATKDLLICPLLKKLQNLETSAQTRSAKILFSDDDWNETNSCFHQIYFHSVTFLQ